MKIGTIQALACVGLGALLGLVAATWGITPPAGAYEARPELRQDFIEARPTATEAKEPVSCSEGTTKTSLLARADARETATGSQPDSPAKKPNILVIWGDDIGIHNISAYNHGIMGYRTPNIDRVAKEGAMFTDFYAQQSCTAGRASFILGQHPFRTGLLTIGMPGSPHGIPDWTPTIADLLKAAGIRDRPVRQEPPGRQQQAPADGTRLRRVLRQPLPPERGGGAGRLLLSQGPRIQEEVWAARCAPLHGDRRRRPHGRPEVGQGRQAEDRGYRAAHQRAHAHHRPGDLRACRRLHRSLGQARRSRSSSGSTPPACTSGPTSRRNPMAGRASVLRPTAWSSTTIWSATLLKKIDDLKLADNTIVIYGTDNGAEVVSWPDGGTTPFHGEKGTTWEGGLRVPCMVRWPGVIKPGTIINEIMSQEDWMPTFLAAAGEPDIVAKLKQGYEAGGKTFKIHADGFNFLPFFKGEVKKSPRDTIYYFGQGGELNAVRWNDWKIHFAVQTGNIATGVRSVPGWPAIVHLRADPYERAVLDSQMYMRWYADQMWLFVPVQEKIKEFLANAPGLSVPGRQQHERSRVSTTKVSRQPGR